MSFDDFGINDSESFMVLIATLIFFIGGAPVRNSAVRVQRREREKNHSSLFLKEDEFKLPFWGRAILFPMFLFSKKPFLKRTIFFRFWNLMITLIMIFICFLPTPGSVQRYIGLGYVLVSLFLAVIFKQHYRDWGGFS